MIGPLLGFERVNQFCSANEPKARCIPQRRKNPSYKIHKHLEEERIEGESEQYVLITLYSRHRVREETLCEQTSSLKAHNSF